MLFTSDHNGGRGRGYGGITLSFFNFFLSMHFCPGTITTHAESINSDIQRGQTFTTHTTVNTEQNQLAIKVSADN